MVGTQTCDKVGAEAACVNGWGRHVRCPVVGIAGLALRPASWHIISLRPPPKHSTKDVRIEQHIGSQRRLVNCRRNRARVLADERRHSQRPPQHAPKGLRWPWMLQTSWLRASSAASGGSSACQRSRSANMPASPLAATGALLSSSPSYNVWRPQQ